MPLYDPGSRDVDSYTPWDEITFSPISFRTLEIVSQMSLRRKGTSKDRQPLGREGGGRFARGEGCLSPISSPQPPLQGSNVRAQKGLRGAREGGPGVSHPPNTPQNGPHDMWIILRRVEGVSAQRGHSGAQCSLLLLGFFAKLSVRATLWPGFRTIFKSTDCLYTKALTFEPPFQDPPPFLLGASHPSPPPQGCIGRGEAPPFKGAQPMPSHCLPDGKCQPSFNGICNRQQPPPTALATSSNRLPNRFWGPFPCNGIPAPPPPPLHDRKPFFRLPDAKVALP